VPARGEGAPGGVDQQLAAAAVDCGDDEILLTGVAGDEDQIAGATGRDGAARRPGGGAAAGAGEQEQRQRGWS
jgi:hypothetical protein